MKNAADIRVLIPAFNVEQYIGKVISGVSIYIPVDRILVVNDGSTDKTGEITREYQVKMISHERNQGKGAALKHGFDYLMGERAQWIITIDGDMQHDPGIIPEFIDKISTERYDLIIGSRNISGSSMPWDRRFSNWSTSKLLSLLCKQTIRDSQCGYRAIRTSFLKGLHFLSSRYEFETELLLKLASKSARIGWVDIPTDYHGSHSSINRLTDTARFLEVVVKHIWEEWKKN